MRDVGSDDRGRSRTATSGLAHVDEQHDRAPLGSEYAERVERARIAEPAVRMSTSPREAIRATDDRARNGAEQVAMTKRYGHFALLDWYRDAASRPVPIV